MDSKILGCVGWLTLVIGVVVISSVINGFILSVLWWFFATIFGLPNLTIPQAIGIGLIITFLTRHSITLTT